MLRIVYNGQSICFLTLKQNLPRFKKKKQPVAENINVNKDIFPYLGVRIPLFGRPYWYTSMKILQGTLLLPVTFPGRFS